MAGRKAVTRVPRFCETAKAVTRVLVGNSSWKKDGKTALYPWYKQTHIRMANTNAIAKLASATKYRYGYARMPDPRAPTMITGRRPIRSVRLPTNGISTTATTLPDTEI